MKNNELSKKDIIDNLDTDFVGRDIILLQSVNSTNQFLKEQDANNVSDGLVIIADMQTAGRGRYDKTFISKSGEGIYLSILLKPKEPIEDIHFLTMCSAVAVAESIFHVCGINSGIKWVNDVFVGNKKICGILTESVMSAEAGRVESIIVGIGINTGEVADEIKDIATSILQVSGLSSIRNKLIAEVLNRFEAAYLDCFFRNKKDSILKQYDEKLFIKGKTVKISEFGNDYICSVTGVDERGALIVMDENNQTRIVTNGEVRLL